MTHAWLTLCLLCVLVAGCGRAGEEDAAPARAGNPVPADGVRVVVTEDDPSLPEGCRPAEVAALLVQLFDALNRGDRAAARAMLVDPGMVDPEPGMVDLLEGAAKPSRLRLRAVIVGYANGLGQIELEVEGRRSGKGAVQCETGRFAAIGVSADAHPDFTPVCGTEPRDAVLACVRHWR